MPYDKGNKRFSICVNSKNTEVNWPPRSCDILPSNAFSGSFVKSEVYAYKPKTKIQCAIAEIESTDMNNLIEKIRVFQHRHGGCLIDIPFYN